MKPEYIDMRPTIPSGQSLKITIPAKIIDEKWRRSRSERFPVCFIQENGKVVMECPEDILRRREYQNEVTEKIKEDWINWRKKEIAKQIEQCDTDLARGKVTKVEYDMRCDELIREFKKMSIDFKRAFSEQELHFIKIRDSNQLVAFLLIEAEQEIEENFVTLLSDVKRIKDEAKELKGIITGLEKEFKEGRIEEKLYKVLKERFKGKKMLADERLERIRKILRSHN